MKCVWCVLTSVHDWALGRSPGLEIYRRRRLLKVRYEQPSNLLCLWRREGLCSSAAAVRSICISKGLDLIRSRELAHPKRKRAGAYHQVFR